jgi:hypothetical protein
MYSQRLNPIDKGAGDFATVVDVETEKMILNVLRVARPAVLGEEGGLQGADAARQWLVDPLCGTLNCAVTNRRPQSPACSRQARPTSIRAVKVQGRRGGDCVFSAAGYLGDVA